jgi:aspartyl/glutamyl-tRNA(Asn/Gln) amidotransferase C subunit
MPRLEAMVKLALPPDERESIAFTLNKLIEHLAPLAAFDAGDTEPLVFLSNAPAAMREDVPARVCGREALLDAAPETMDGYYKIPLIGN